MASFADKIKQQSLNIYVYIGMAVLLASLVLLEQPFNSVMVQIFGARSEYTFGEQLTKLLLLTIAQISFLSYLSSKLSKKINLSISFLVFSLCLYLSESNMITENTQPFFGLALLSLITYYSIRLRAWKCIIFLSISIFLIASGSALDRLGELQSSELSAFAQGILDLASYINFREETFDILGVIAITISALSVFIDVFNIFPSGKRYKYLALLMGNILMAMGNGFLHYQYGPNNKVYLLGMAMSIAGFLILFVATRELRLNWDRQPGISSETVFVFLFAFFVFLPGTFGHSRYLQSILLWIPTLLFIGWYLKSVHPTLAGESIKNTVRRRTEAG